MTPLKIGGCLAENLAKEYGTPLYVYDEAEILENMRDLRENFISENFATQVLYASKAFQTVQMINLAADNDLGLDVVSGGEIFVAQHSKMAKDKIYFHGNNKTPQELTEFLQAGLTHLVIDNLAEAKTLAEISSQFPQTVQCFIRLNVGVEAHTHQYILTSYVDSKFGLAFDSIDCQETLKVIAKAPNLELAGFHAHIGSQIFELTAWEKEIQILVGLLKNFPQPLSLNLGGGFGISYVPSDTPIPLAKVAQHLIATVEQELIQQKVSLKTLLIEPGRSLVGSAGTTLYTVGYDKKTPHKHYVFVDGGMTDNIRPALYQASYSCDLAKDLAADKTETYTIAGKMCESGDVLIENVPLPKVTAGDILAIYDTGAYGYSMSSNYNQALKPSVVFVKNGQSRLVVKRQTYEDLLANEVQTHES